MALLENGTRCVAGLPSESGSDDGGRERGGYSPAGGCQRDYFREKFLRNALKKNFVRFFKKNFRHEPEKIPGFSCVFFNGGIAIEFFLEKNLPAFLIASR